MEIPLPVTAGVMTDFDSNRPLADFFHNISYPKVSSTRIDAPSKAAEAASEFAPAKAPSAVCLPG